MLFERLLRSFQDTNLRYAVIGGIAVNLYGYNRLTGDLDILTSLTDENLSKFIRISRELGLVPRFSVSLDDLANEQSRTTWITEKNLKVFSVYNPEDPLEHLDVKIDKPSQIEAYIDRAKVFEAGDIKISVVSFDDLITLKKEAGRSRDLIDIKALERIRRLDD